MFLCSLRIIPSERKRRRKKKKKKCSLTYVSIFHTLYVASSQDTTRGEVIYESTKQRKFYFSTLPNRHFARHAGGATNSIRIAIYTSTSFSNWLFHRDIFRRVTPRDPREKRKGLKGKRKEKRRRRRKRGNRQKT